MKYPWVKQIITTEKEFNRHKEFLGHFQADYCFLDTETTGLNIKWDKPFVVQFGFIYQGHGYAFAIDLEQSPILGRAAVDLWLRYATGCKKLVGHNLSFDLHMLRNIGFKYTRDNITDTTFYIRYGHDSKSVNNGGPPLGLKEYATRYIDRKARDHEQLIKQERTAIAAQYNRQLVQALGMKKGVFDEFFKDPLHDLEDLPAEKVRAFQNWKASLPSWLRDRFEVRLESSHIPYTHVNRELLIQYALDDIVYTAEIFYSLVPVVRVRKTQTAIEYEDKLIQPLIDMERTGFKVDVEYLLNAQHKMKNYILQRRQELYEMVQEEIRIGQHQRIKQLLKDRYNILLVSTNATELSRHASDLERGSDNPEALEFIKTIQELRTLEKWYAVYILRFRQDAVRTGYVYTTINQVGTVSGRVTSDFQQFPKYGIVTREGEELFHPRKMVCVPGGPFNALVYIDYSQIELRLQAMYTILVGHPDKNLCRAYMPYECVDVEGKLFDPQDPKDIARWQEHWVHQEDGEPWEPVDVHGATTMHAFDIGPDHPDYKRYRSIGKTVNFCKNYGGQRGQIRNMFPEFSEDQITKIDEAYYKAFPGVKEYHSYCYNLALSRPYATNLLGVRYYNVSGHLLINMLIQGSGAYFLKWKIRQLWEYMKAKGYKSQMQMNIHDEISWVYHKDDPPGIFKELQEIMQVWDDTLVPITADIEISKTTWAEKKEYTDAQEINTCLSNG